MVERDNGNVHRAAAKINVSKSRAARGSVCNVLLSDGRSGVLVVTPYTLNDLCFFDPSFGVFVPQVRFMSSRVDA